MDGRMPLRLRLTLTQTPIPQTYVILAISFLSGPQVPLCNSLEGSKHPVRSQRPRPQLLRWTSSLGGDAGWLQKEKEAALTEQMSTRWQAS